MKNSRRITTVAGIGLAAMLLATGCGSGSDEPTAASTLTGDELHAAAKEEGSLSFYCSAAPTTCEAIAEGYKETTGAEITMLRSTSPDAAARYGSEKKSRAKTADVLLNSEFGFYSTALEEGIIKNFEDAGFLPDDYPEDWVLDGEGVTGLPYISETLGIGVNTDKVAEADRPKSWLDLGDAKWKGQMNGPAPTNASFSVLYGTLDAKVPGFIDGLAGQDIFGDTGGMVSLTEALSSGEYSVQTLAAPTIVGEAKKDGAPVEWIIPEEGMTGPAFAFLLNDSPERPNSQKAFAEYVTSPAMTEKLSGISEYLLSAYSEPDFEFITPDLKYFTEGPEQDIVDRMAGKK